MAGVNIATAYLSIVPSMDGFSGRLQRQMADVNTDRIGRDAGDNYHRGFASVAGKLTGVLGAAFAAVKVGDFAKDAINQASDLQEVGTKMQAIFGDATGTVQAFGDQGAKALGQTSLQAQNAAATFGIFGKAAGLSAQENAGFSTELAKLATDMASFSNTTPEDAINALSSGLRGEAEPLRNYGVLLDDASLRQEAMAQGLITTTKDALTPQQKVLAAHALIMKQTQLAQGDFERTSGGLANQQRILAAQWSDSKAKLGEVFLPAVTGVVSTLNEKLMPALSNVGPAISDMWSGLTMDAGTRAEFDGQMSGMVEFGANVRSKLEPVMGTIGPLFKDAFDQIGPMLKGVWDTIGPMLNQAMQTIGPIFEQVGAVLGPVFADVFNTLKPAIEKLLPIFAQLLPVMSPVKLIFEALLPLLPKIAEIFGQLARVVADIVAKAIEALAPLLQKVVEVVNRLMPFITDLVASLLPPLMSLFESLVPLIEAIANALMPVVDAIVAALIPAIDALMPIVERVFTFIADTIRNVMQVVKGIIDVITGIFTGDWEKVWTGIKEIFGGIWDQIKNIFSTVMDLIVQIFTNLGPTLWGILTGLIGTVLGWGASLIGWLVEGIATAASALWDWFIGLPAAIWGLIQTAAAVVSGWGASLIGWIKDGIVNGAVAVWTWFTNLPDALWGTIQTVWSTVIDWGKSLIASILLGITFAVIDVFNWFTALPGNLWAAIQSIWATAVSWGSSLFNWVWDGIKNIAVNVWQWFLDLPGNLWAAIQAIWATAVSWGSSLFNWVWDGIKNIAVNVWQWFLDLPGNLWGFIVGGWQAVVHYGSDLMTWIWQGTDGNGGIVGAFVAVKQWFFDLPSTLWTAISKAWEAFTNWGTDIGNKIANGIGNSKDAVLNAIKNLFSIGFDVAGAHVTMGFDGSISITTGAHGAVVPGIDTGKDNQIAAVRSGEAIMVPQFTHAVGGLSGVMALNRAAENGLLGYADGGVIDAKGKGGGWFGDVGYGAGVATGDSLKNRIHDAIMSMFDLFGGASYEPGGGVGVRGKFLDAVASKMGTAYVWGDAGPNTFDCSGLMSWGLEQAGAGVGRLTAQQFNERFNHVTTPQPGDLVTFDTGRDVTPGPGNGAGHIGAVFDVINHLMMHTDGAGPARKGDYLHRDGGPLSYLDVLGGTWATASRGSGGSFGGGTIGTGVEQWRSTALAALAAAGQSASWVDDLLRQMNQESSGNKDAINLTDSNARRGTPSQGLMQLIWPTFRDELNAHGFGVYATPGMLTSPFPNILAGILHTVDNYGDLGYWARNGFGAYDDGGWLMPGQMGVNNLTQPEAVLNPAQSAALISHADALQRGYSGQMPNVNVFIGGERINEIVRVEIDDSFSTLASDIDTAKGQAW